MRRFISLIAIAFAVQSALAEDLAVTGIKAVHHDGQTFVTFKDVAEGEAGAAYRYNLYRSDRPITQANLAQAELAISGLLNNSAIRYGWSFNSKSRLGPDSPMAVIAEGSDPLPRWSGLAVHTVDKDGAGFYAVVATGEKGKPVTQVAPGESATVEPVAEKVAPIAPIKIGDSKTRGRYARILAITGEKNLPLHVGLHASSSRGGPGSSHGSYYLLFGRPEWGFYDGMPSQFTVGERMFKPGGRRLLLDSRETICTSAGRPMETYWFGYYCVPQRAKEKQPRAYPFTERRMLWTIDWVIGKYNADPERVYASGGSMGAWGSSTFAFRHPEVFAAVYPNRPRTRQRGLPSLVKFKRGSPALMPDGVTSYYDRMNMVKFAAEHHADLPFLGWCCGRRDGFASWREQIDMVKALTAAHHGFAFAFNDGGHGSGSRPMREVAKYYPARKFARNVSYPAFGNSSIDDDLGSGELVEQVVDGKKKRVLKDGALTGGVNLGFDWTDVVDEAEKWSAKLSNVLAKDQMTVDVTPRRCRKFKPKPGEEFKWTHSAGGEGEVTADRWGLVTVEKVRIKPGQPTVLTIAKGSDVAP